MQKKRTPKKAGDACSDSAKNSTLKRPDAGPEKSKKYYVFNVQVKKDRNQLRNQLRRQVIRFYPYIDKKL